MMNDSSTGESNDNRDSTGSSTGGGIDPEVAGTTASSGDGAKAAKAAKTEQKDNLWGQVPGWLRWLAIGIAVIVGFLTICALVYAVIVIFNIPMPGFMDHIGASDKSGTGEIGDTFGGLLAPILTAGALIATVLFAIQQGNQAKKSTQDQIDASAISTQSQIDASREILQDEQKTAAKERERHRAEQVYAWIAETVEDNSSFWRGILVINDSRVPAQKVDFNVSVESGSGSVDSETQTNLTSGAIAAVSGNYFDREAIIPPGKWFIPFQTGSHGDPISDSTVQWRTLMPVDSSSGLFVRIDSPAEEDGESDVEGPKGGYRRELTVHSRTKGVYDGEEISFPFYTVNSMRYNLDGARWLRTSNRGVFKMDEQFFNEAESASLVASWPSDSVMDELEVTPRAYAGRKKLPLSDMTRPVAGFLEFVLRKVSASTSNDILHDAYTRSLPPRAEVLSGVHAIELFGKKKENGRNFIHSQTLGFHLYGGGELLVPVSRRDGGTIFRFPGDQMAVLGVANEEIKIEGYGKGVPTRLKNAAKRVIDGLVSPDSEKYSEDFWLNNEDGLTAMLQALVSEASAIVREVSADLPGGDVK